MTTDGRIAVISVDNQAKRNSYTPDDHRVHDRPQAGRHHHRRRQPG